MNKKLLWFNPNIEYLFHGNIVEYDMRAMSVSVSEKYNLLDPDTIANLKLLPKDQRTKKVGLLQRDNKEYSERLISCELETRRKFLEANNLDESNVISLHSDACIFNSKSKINRFIEGIEFKHENTWTSYIRFNGLEIFRDDDNTIVYKGAPKDLTDRHILGIQKYLLKIFDKVENYDSSVISFMSTFQDQYLRDKLPETYYMSFGKLGDYKMYNLQFFAAIANIVLADMKGW